MRRSRGTIRNLTFRYNQLISEEMDKKKALNDSRGEMLDKIKNSK